MDYKEIIHNEYAEPASVFSYRDGEIRVLDINSRFLPELWMNISIDDFKNADPCNMFDEENERVFMNAVKKCIESGEEQIVETWRNMFSNCCGFDKICLRSRLVLIEKRPEEAIVYESVRNISNERIAQDTLADVEYRYKKTSEQVNIYNWEYDVKTKEMRPCYRCMRDLGLPALVTNYPEPAIDMGIFPPDYADMYRDMMHQVDSGVPEIEADIPLTVGRIPFRVKYSTEFDEGGRPVKAFGSATLISEMELGHIKLDDQIIGTLAEEYSCIYLLDFIKDEVRPIKEEDPFSIGEHTDCGYLLSLIGSKIRDVSDGEAALMKDVSGFRKGFSGDSPRREFVYRDDDSSRWVRIDLHIMERSTQGIDRLLITVSYVDDIRAQKMDADRLIASQKEELEDRQQMLLAAIDEANRANEAKTAFFSSMSHDIRTPMNAITGFSRLAVDEMDNREHLSEYLDKIVTAGDHLMELINDILDMSRIESGKMELSLSPVRIKDLLLECADMIRVRMDEKGLAFDVDIEKTGTDTVSCDKVRFSQVILNLLSNAYKFTPEGGSVYLGAEVTEQDDRLVYKIRVKDTGIGMSEEFSRHIWEAYSREDTETVRNTQGTGLGMVIVRNIINLMQGTIDLKTSPGEGSEFIIVLPLEKAGDDQLSYEAGGISEDAMKRNYEGVRILVVDDTATNLKLAQRVLEKYGIDVIRSDSGVDAVRIVKDSRPGEIDMILMDVLMPVMDGLEATRRIRSLEDESLASIPIIAMTANAFESDIQQALDAGMNAHVPKPFRTEELLKVIAANLKEKGRSAHK